MSSFYSLVDQNKRRSWFVVIGFIVFIAGASYLISQAFDFGPSFVGLALIFAGFGSLFSYYYSDKMILTMSGAQEATRERYFDFYTVTENLCLAAQLPMPRLYVIDDSAMNAFATGRDPQHAVVCATTGILSRLNRTELEGVIAHELSHIKNYDMRLMSLVTILVGTITLLADWLLRSSFWGGSRRRNNNSEGGAIFMVLGLVMAFLSPIIAQLIQLAISRRREFLADASGVSITKYPEGLARALEKLSQDQEALEVANKATAHLYICNPFHLDSNHLGSHASSGVSWFSNLFNTHPPLKDRIAALRQIA